MPTTTTIQFEFSVVFFLSVAILESWTNHEDHVSYDDLLALNVSCKATESCLTPSDSANSPEISKPYLCSCHEQCWEYGTCCIDSPFRRHTNTLQECRGIGPETPSVLMVSECPHDADGDSVWKDLCEGEWKEGDDILRLAPVTSLTTNVTYKNVYCLRCHEKSDNFLHWSLLLSRPKLDSNETVDLKNDSVSYDQANKTWVARSDDESVSIPVELNFITTPDFPVPSPKPCKSSVISKCHDSWADDQVRVMCKAYTSYRYMRFDVYKNPHCALCNHLSLRYLSCSGKEFHIFKEILSFHHLLKIDREDEEKSGNLRRCEENEVWDPYRKKCHKLVCAVPDFVVRNGRCSKL